MCHGEFSPSDPRCFLLKDTLPSELLLEVVFPDGDKAQRIVTPSDLHTIADFLENAR